MLILRFPRLNVESASFYKECKTLVGLTKYKRLAKREEAPALADCLTAASYIFKKAGTDLPLDWIGNMPRLLKNRGWSVQKISKEELKPGDLLFLGKGRSLVSHLAIALNQEEVFHTSWEAKGGAIEKIENVFFRYSQPQEMPILLSYVDPRTLRDSPFGSL